jgi:hypothetical protein
METTMAYVYDSQRFVTIRTESRDIRIMGQHEYARDAMILQTSD